MTETRSLSPPIPENVLIRVEVPARPMTWMVSGALAFAAMGACTYALGSRCDWLVIALTRVIFMFISTAIVARLVGVPLVFLRPRTLWIRSLAGSFSLVCNFYAMTRLPLADVLTLTNTYPLWILMATAIGMRRGLTIREFSGVAAALLGVFLIQRPDLSGDRTAALVALVSSFSTAVAMLGLHRLKAIDPRAVVVHFAGVAGIVALAGLALRRSDLHPFQADFATIALLFGVGVFGTVGQVLLTKAYAAGAPTKVSVAGLTQVVFAVCFDVLIWRRSLSLPTLLGMALILTPTAWLSGRSRPASGTSEDEDAVITEAVQS